MFLDLDKTNFDIFLHEVIDTLPERHKDILRSYLESDTRTKTYPRADTLKKHGLKQNAFAAALDEAQDALKEALAERNVHSVSVFGLDISSGKEVEKPLPPLKPRKSRGAATKEGKPCIRCSCTLRYVRSQGCVACSQRNSATQYRR